MTDREKMVNLLCEANSISVDAELFEDSSYAQQLEIEADFLIANGVTIPVRCKDCKHWCEDTLSCMCGNHYDDNWYGEDFCSYGERRTDVN